ncbi:MAG: class I SAM-dependent methyltransferase, partial [Elusimicrobia bacterium]|nr:class I SAM-dependent methyltransferase [Elusimicrobiota bacterium]
GNWKTIYEGLSSLPEDVKKSWFDFDHFYSDNSFEQVIKIILESNPKRVFDIGCNTGKFETAMFKNGYAGTMVMIDLQKQLNMAKQNMEKLNKLDNCEFFPTNILDSSLGLPNNPDVVLMSQFLDCFSLEEIVSILKKVKNVMLGGTKVFILEPFWDKQKFEAAKLSLTHISLYFTALANGNSKMYSCNEMLDCINKSGLRLSKIHENIGPFEYTLLECSK